MSHTPGPWTLVFDVDGPPGFIWGKTTCVCDFGKDVPKPEDARLIAAAPELLEMFEEALANVERVTDGSRKAVPALAKWLEKARAVLAKVRGEKSE